MTLSWHNTIRVITMWLKQQGNTTAKQNHFLVLHYVTWQKKDESLIFYILSSAARKKYSKTCLDFIRETITTGEWSNFFFFVWAIIFSISVLNPVCTCSLKHVRTTLNKPSSCTSPCGAVVHRHGKSKQPHTSPCVCTTCTPCVSHKVYVLYILYCPEPGKFMLQHLLSKAQYI